MYTRQTNYRSNPTSSRCVTVPARVVDSNLRTMGRSIPNKKFPDCRIRRTPKWPHNSLSVAWTPERRRGRIDKRRAGATGAAAGLESLQRPFGVSNQSL